MILSVSRRTDIPAFYTPWFLNRLRDGFVLVRNPMNPRRVSRISLSRDVLDAVVFWTKNPLPLLPYLDELGEIPYYFQFTLTSYGQDIEPGVPSKNDVLVPAFREMAQKLGRKRLVWRYDPILISEKYSPAYHIRYFRALAEKLADCTDVCTISFLDYYRNTEKRVSPYGVRTPDAGEIDVILTEFSKIARETEIALKTCAEDGDYSRYGVTHAACIDKDRLARIIGQPLSLQRDKNQRGACGCYESIDIGAYNTCPHGCLYCYANYIPSTVTKNAAAHDPASPLLFGRLSDADIVTERAVTSCRTGGQISLKELHQ